MFPNEARLCARKIYAKGITKKTLQTAYAEHGKLEDPLSLHGEL